MFLSVVSRVILVDHWCAKMALVNLGKFMASPALVQLVVLWTRNPQCSPAPLPTCPGSTISSAETATTNTVRNDFVRKIIKKINVQKHFPLSSNLPVQYLVVEDQGIWLVLVETYSP